LRIKGKGTTSHEISSPLHLIRRQAGEIEQHSCTPSRLVGWISITSAPQTWGFGAASGKKGSIPAAWRLHR
jgi:hypothetical protein